MLLVLQVINLIIDTAPHAAAPPSGLGLTPAPAPASTAPKPEPAPSMPSAQSQPQLQPLPLPQQSISSASGTPSKYTGFGSDNSSRSGPDHKPLATYFTNAPAPAPVSASVHVLGHAQSAGSASTVLSLSPSTHAASLTCHLPSPSPFVCPVPSPPPALCAPR